MNQLMQLYLDNRSIPKVPVSVVRNGDVASISMRGIVIPEEGINAEEVAQAIAQAGDASTIVFNINTPGGSVFEAREIMDIIRNTSAKTVAHIGSLCASAGTSIALACDEVEMADGAHFMIHNAQAVIGGDKTALRKAADAMEKIEQAIVNDYTTKTGKDAAEIIQMMDATTWMTAQEALAGGFIDRIAEAAKTRNTWNLASLEKVPEELKGPAPDPAPPDPEPKNESTEPAPEAGFFMSAANANRLRLAQIA